ncbi:MAG: hypothetical protein ACJAZ1_000334 [Yoonia sp.]|jgi:hypothetical protein
MGQIRRKSHRCCALFGCDFACFKVQSCWLRATLAYIGAGLWRVGQSVRAELK